MRFQIEDTIDTSDQTLVLGALERSVVPISLNVVRADGELRVYGIGPSLRPVNSRNLTVFRVEGAGYGQTRVKVESEFLASALLEVSAQEPAVREKIEHVMELAKEEVGLRRRSARQTSIERTSMEGTSIPIAESSNSRLPARGEPAPYSTRSQAPATHSQAEAADPGPPAVGETAPRISVSRAAAGADALSFQVDSVAPTAGSPTEMRDIRHPDRAESTAWSGALRHRDWERPEVLQIPLTSPRRETVWWKLVVPLAVLLLVACIYLFGRWQKPSPKAATKREAPEIAASSAPLRKESPVSSRTPAVQVMAASRTLAVQALTPSKTSVKTSTGGGGEARATFPAKAGSETQPTPPATQNREWQAGQPAAPQNDSPVSSLATTPPSLRERLDQWAASMRSTDAAAQASFYANHLDRYFLRTDVDQAFVLRDKQDFLRRGNRVDRFDAEDVQMQDSTDSSARLRLIKHYVVRTRPNAAPVERQVRSELSLRKIDGEWQITEERDFNN